ncbi:MAG: hypothetical protein J7J82_01935 [Staphylothermus sp.]|nr:hypothetical protein [Staphylothermus sp.]
MDFLNLALVPVNVVLKAMDIALTHKFVYEKNRLDYEANLLARRMMKRFKNNWVFVAAFSSILFYLIGFILASSGGVGLFYNLVFLVLQIEVNVNHFLIDMFHKEFYVFNKPAILFHRILERALGGGNG